ncbi:PHP domain-containing protein [candidate division KSB1 bacterium]|nr:PHP domain-containing protein [candidate division KSB1 bacterium]
MIKVKQNFDFHVHTNASDGSYDPGELVKYVAEQGLNTIAITDHDTVSGVEKALQAGKTFSVTVIPGVEISVDYSPGTMHICGYFIDINNDILNSGLDFVQKARKERNPQIIKKLNDAGIDITLDEVKQIAGPDQVGRPHFAKVLLEKGIVKSTKEAFTKYLAKGASCYVDKKRLKIDEAVQMIRKAGGVVVLAHPVQLKMKDTEDYRKLFAELKKSGIDGIEAYSSYNTEKENIFFTKLAEEFGFIITGGSDFHGETKPGISPGQLGNEVDINIDALLKEMRNISKNRRNGRNNN